MTVLVTGGKGFIGARLIQNLVARGEKVVCFELRAKPGRLRELANEITMVEGDVVNYQDISCAIAQHGVDRIAHMVFYSPDDRGVDERPGQASELYKQQMIMNAGTFNLFEAARASGVKRVIFPSSIQYHGHDNPWTEAEPVNENSPALPTTMYGIGKHLCERLAQEYARLHGMDIVSIRVPGAYGPGARVGARGVNLIGTNGALGQPIKFSYQANQHIVLAHVDDIAEIIAKALLGSRLPRQVYHVGGHYVSYRDLARHGKELLRGLEVSFNDTAPLVCSFRIDCSWMEQDLGVRHRSLRDGYLGLINLTRVEHGLPSISAPA